MTVHSDLKLFLMKRPRPVKVRCKGEDGERILEMPMRRGGFQELERTILAIDPITVEILDKDGTVVRAANLRDDAEETEEKAGAKDQALTAAMLDNFGKHLVCAFKEGVAASSSQQEKLTQLVGNLMEHVQALLAGVHKMAAANAALQAQSISGNDTDDMAAKVMALIVSGGNNGASAPNGSGMNGGSR